MILIMREDRLSQKTKSGNILFLILIAVALFAALSYTVTQMGRTPGNTIEDEKAKLSQAEIDSYTAQLNQGKTRLELINNCKNIDYTPPADQVAGDKSCHMFHPDGGGVVYLSIGLGLGCDLLSLAIGENCNGIVYAGISGGNRLYTTLNGSGSSVWGPSGEVSGANSSTNGLSNTIILSNLSYHPASICRNLGEEWYLPSENELATLMTNRAIGVLAGSLDGAHWSSTEFNASRACFQTEDFRFCNTTGSNKTNNWKIRCVRR